MNEHRFLDRLARGDVRNVRFTELCRLVKALGFEQRRISEDDGGYIADIPDLDACSAFGDTPEQAVAEVLRAKEAWLAVAAEAGHGIMLTDDRPRICGPA